MGSCVFKYNINKVPCVRAVVRADARCDKKVTASKTNSKISQVLWLKKCQLFGAWCDKGRIKSQQMAKVLHKKVKKYIVIDNDFIIQFGCFKTNKGPKCNIKRNVEWKWSKSSKILLFFCRITKVLPIFVCKTYFRTKPQKLKTYRWKPLACGLQKVQVCVSCVCRLRRHQMCCTLITKNSDIWKFLP